MYTSIYKSILLIDDDTDDQEIFVAALKEVSPNIRCYCEDDGEVAMKLLSKNEIAKPDLFFIDLNMPRLNGKEVLKKIKSTDSLKNIPVIMFSTFFGEGDIKEFSSWGAVHYMVKSTNFSDLCKTLGDTLSKKW